jgi:hypothetical protein
MQPRYAESMDTDETADWARARLLEYRRTVESRDERIRKARKLGMSKSEIFSLSGVARTTIDRILEGAPDNGQS